MSSSYPNDVNDLLADRALREGPASVRARAAILYVLRDMQARELPLEPLKPGELPLEPMEGEELEAEPSEPGTLPLEPERDVGDFLYGDTDEIPVGATPTNSPCVIARRRTIRNLERTVARSLPRPVIARHFTKRTSAPPRTGRTRERSRHVRSRRVGSSRGRVRGPSGDSDPSEPDVARGLA
jgi:hypothetical protein